MKKKTLRFGEGFRVHFGNKRAQVAEMVIKPGGSEGGPTNRHQGADQWLFVIAGEGLAIVDKKRIELKPGLLVMIEAREIHQIKNTGDDLLRTLNFYTPPAFNKAGDPMVHGREGPKKTRGK